MTFQLPNLPFGMDDLSPHLSKETIDYHYHKHHKGYVNKLNHLIPNTPFANKSLEAIIKVAPPGNIFNNAAQIWNHNFYWQCLTPNSSKSPSGELSSAITQHFQSFHQFKETFNKIAMSTFGSGWVWLVKDNQSNLTIISTSNAENPLTQSLIPMLTCDVWEHAYYIDYRNLRLNYMQAFWEIVNWQHVKRCFTFKES